MAPLQRWKRAEQLRSSFENEAARLEYHTLLSDPDWVLPARLRLGALALETGQVRDAVAHALAAHAAIEPDAVLLEAVCRLLLNVGELRAALNCVENAAVQDCDDPAVLLGIGRMMSEQGLPGHSLPLLRRAQAFGADTAEVRYLIGNDEAYSGNVEAATRQLEACLVIAPDYALAHKALSRLRKATPERNDVARLRITATRIGEKHRDTPLLQYALFKQLDDLGYHDTAWEALATGMRLRRAQVRHSDHGEANLFDELLKVRAKPPQPLVPGPAPIFIVGMPRSGTTLLERMLGAHPLVTDAGELRDFTVQLRWCCNLLGGPHIDASLARAAASADLSDLGPRYLAHTRWQADRRPFYTDKLPTNFLTLGYLANALPQARFLHMVRDPMDVCFSNLKELFADAYPHSYDQVEMATHFRRYRQLMAHWHAQFPGRILDVPYANLVANPEAVARSVLAHCELPWERRVLSVEARDGIVATPSWAQVREPIHSRYVGQWKTYEAKLQPLREALGDLAA